MNLNRSTLRLLGLFTLTATFAWAAEPLPKAELLEARKIWDAAPHNAFTDLVRFEDRWFCVFREGQAHVSPDGALRVITSQDGLEWRSAAFITSTNADLRDAKITITPDHQLMLSGVGALHPPAPIKHQSLAWFSKDGQNWSEPVKIGDPNLWLWRTTWHKGVAYSIGYDTTAEKFIRLYTSKNGREFETLLPRLFDEGYPNETSLVFLPDDTCLCLLRRDGNPGSGKLGLAKPPYTKWEWKDLGLKIGGPHLLRLADGRIVAAARLYDGGARTSLLWLDAEAGKLTEFLKLPSGGDSSYPGLVWHDGLLWVSYYSSHEGKTCIYLAKVRLPAL
ncbi:MAG: exo-alpha-sialidase [Verrucomicrobiota bacterium]